MLIRNIEVPVDILRELESYLDKFRDYRIRGDKLQSCSPFRYENHPSFAVNLENGTWIDSGSPTEHYHKGNFITLLAYLRQEEYLLTEEYLLSSYHIMLAEVDKLKLTIELESSECNKTFDWKNECKHLHFRHPYLSRRGITQEVQRLFLIGYDREHDSVAMPWISTDKEVINIKYRSTRNKYFYYEEDGQLTRNYVYGLAQCIHFGYTDVAIVESEIDCMSFWSVGIPAVAVGHCGLNPSQLKLLQKYVKTITIAVDNDSSGNRFAAELKKSLLKDFIVYEMTIPMQVKDVNDLLVNHMLENTFKSRKLVGINMSLKL